MKSQPNHRIATHAAHLAVVLLDEPARLAGCNWATRRCPARLPSAVQAGLPVGCPCAVSRAAVHRAGCRHGLCFQPGLCPAEGFHAAPPRAGRQHGRRCWRIAQVDPRPGPRATKLDAPARGQGGTIVDQTIKLERYELGNN